MRDYRAGKSKWVAADIKQVLIPDVTFECEVENEQLTWKRHVNQVLRRKQGIVKNDAVEQNSSCSEQVSNPKQVQTVRRSPRIAGKNIVHCEQNKRGRL